MEDIKEQIEAVERQILAYENRPMTQNTLVEITRLHNKRNELVDKLIDLLNSK